MKPILYPATREQLEALGTRPAGTYIFRGPQSVGKLTAARWVAARALCPAGVCGSCRDCKLIAAGSHPALAEVSPDGRSVGIDQVKALQQNLKLSGYSAGSRLAVIDEADSLTPEAQNALLKLLEEPPHDTAIILISHGGDVLLATILSRSRIINFTPVEPVAITGHLKALGLSAEAAREVADWSEGLPGRATTLAEDETLRESYRRADKLVNGLLGSEPFERLVTAASLAEEPATLELFISRLATRLRVRLRQGDGLRQSQALERFRHHRAGNVPVKAALESLVLDL